MVEVVRRFTVRRDRRLCRSMGSRPAAEFLLIAIPDRGSLLRDRGLRLKLCKQDGGKQIRKHITRSEIDPGVFVGLPPEELLPIGALFMNDFRPFHQAGIVY